MEEKGNLSSARPTTTTRRTRKLAAFSLIACITSSLFLASCWKPPVPTVSSFFRGSNGGNETSSASLSSSSKSPATASLNTGGKSSRKHTTVQVRFVFFQGIEGTGHHLLRHLLDGSPAVQKIRSMELATAMGAAAGAAFHPRKGYLNLHCEHPTTEQVDLKRDELVMNLRNISAKIAKQHHSNANGNGDDHLLPAFPLNGIVWPNSSSGTMVSYPMNGKACRFHRYPDLNLLYDACQEAGVLCQQVYLYRDPYAVIRSTSFRRQFNRDVYEAARLYTSMLMVLHSQLLTFPDRTLACINFYDTSLPREEVWDPIQNLFGWGSGIDKQSEFDMYVKQKYIPPSPVNESTRQQFIMTYGPYMDSMIRAHNSVADMCRQQALQNKKNRGKEFLAS